MKLTAASFQRQSPDFFTLLLFCLLNVKNFCDVTVFEMVTLLDSFYFKQISHQVRVKITSGICKEGGGDESNQIEIFYLYS